MLEGRDESLPCAFRNTQYIPTRIPSRLSSRKRNKLTGYEQEDFHRRIFFVRNLLMVKYIYIYIFLVLFIDFSSEREREEGEEGRKREKHRLAVPLIHALPG